MILDIITEIGLTIVILLICWWILTYSLLWAVIFLIGSNCWIRIQKKKTKALREQLNAMQKKSNGP